MNEAKGLRVWSVWVLLFALATTAWAHDRNMTGLKIRLDKGEVTVGVVAHLHDLKTADPSAEIAARLKLRFDGEAFSPSKVQLIRDDANGIVMWQAKQKGSATWVAVDAPIFPENTEQTTVVTVFKNRQILDEAVLNAAHPTTVIGKDGVEAGISTVFSRFLREGVVHIFGGLDHVLFLISLLLLGGTWKQLLKIATAFTLAHSITLSLATTNLFSLPPRFVEPVIALSIVAVALANFRASGAEKETKQVDFRLYLAFGFGLIHGFGFAGALGEVGLPRQTLGWALLAFNLGVEAGQAALVLLFAPLLAALINVWPSLQVPVVRYGSAGVAVIGTFWFVQRLIAA
jgi:hydrogenase/urease accessory protein HupE